MHILQKKGSAMSHNALYYTLSVPQRQTCEKILITNWYMVKIKTENVYRYQNFFMINLVNDSGQFFSVRTKKQIIV